MQFRFWNHEDIKIPGNLLNEGIKFIPQGIYICLPYDLFSNLVPDLDLKVPSKLLCQVPEIGDKILAAV